MTKKEKYTLYSLIGIIVTLLTTTIGLIIHNMCNTPYTMEQVVPQSTNWVGLLFIFLIMIITVFHLLGGIKE